MPTVTPAPIAFTAQPGRATTRRGGRSAGIACTVSCTECGTVEVSASFNNQFRCRACILTFAEKVRYLASLGMTYAQIGAALGIGRVTVYKWCSTHKISTKRASVAPAESVLRELADSGMTRKSIAVRVGRSVAFTNDLLKKYGISTSGAKPPEHVTPTAGIGQKPPKLVPSARALSLVSVWGLAGGVGHASSFEQRQPVIQAVSPF